MLCVENKLREVDFAAMFRFPTKKSKNDVAFLTHDERVLMFRSSLIDGQILGESSAFVRAKKTR